LPPVGDSFEVAKNDLSLFVSNQVLEKVHLVHIELVSDTGKLAEPQVFRFEAVHHHGGHPAALGNHGNPAHGHGGLKSHEGNRQAVSPVHDSQAVGADHAYAVGTQDADHLVLQGTAFVPQFPESSRHEDRPLDSLFTAISQDFGDRRRRDENGGQVHPFGKLPHPGIDLVARKAPSMGTHQVNEPLEPELEQVVDDGLGQVPGIGGNSDHGDASSLEKPFHS